MGGGPDSAATANAGLESLEAGTLTFAEIANTAV
jgi:hypothetical protein